MSNWEPPQHKLNPAPLNSEGGPYNNASAIGENKMHHHHSLISKSGGRRLKGGAHNAVQLHPIFKPAGHVGPTQLSTHGQQHLYNHHVNAKYDHCANGNCTPIVTKGGGSRQRRFRKKHTKRRQNSKKRRQNTKKRRQNTKKRRQNSKKRR